MLPSSRISTATSIAFPPVAANQDFGVELNLEDLARSHAESVLRDSCPLRRSFVERAEGVEDPTPLARLLRTQGDVGGKGGGLRVSLLLSLIWLCAKQPYTTTRVAAYWAELLGRDDPREEGARVIRDCLHELRERGLIELAARGTRVEIALRIETSRPEASRPYIPPYEFEPYLSIPRAFWATGLAGKLSGAGIAMYLVALAMTRHTDPDFFLSGEFFEERFGISRSSRKRGLAELIKHGALTVRSVESVDLATFRRVRRNVYTVTKEFLQPAPKEMPEYARSKDSLAESVSKETEGAGAKRKVSGEDQLSDFLAKHGLSGKKSTGRIKARDSN